MGLGRKVVNFIWLNVINQPPDNTGIGQIAVMKKKFAVVNMGINIEVIDPASIKSGRPSDYAVNLVTFGEQQFGKIRTVLAGYAGDEGNFATALFHN
jgi:hypothetical protein